MSGVLSRLGLLCLIIFAALPASQAQQPQILVFAAASLTEAVQELGAAYEKTARVTVKPLFDSSSTLARQIEAGAPADVFFSAGAEWIDYLQNCNLIQAASRKNVLGNRLVLIAPAEKPDSTQNCTALSTGGGAR